MGFIACCLDDWVLNTGDFVADAGLRSPLGGIFEPALCPLHARVCLPPVAATCMGLSLDIRPSPALAFWSREIACLSWGRAPSTVGRI